MTDSKVVADDEVPWLVHVAVRLTLPADLLLYGVKHLLQKFDVNVKY